MQDSTGETLMIMTRIFWMILSGRVGNTNEWLSFHLIWWEQSQPKLFVLNVIINILWQFHICLDKYAKASYWRKMASLKLKKNSKNHTNQKLFFLYNDLSASLTRLDFLHMYWFFRHQSLNMWSPPIWRKTWTKHSAKSFLMFNWPSAKSEGTGFLLHNLKILISCNNLTASHFTL